jgi:hypothetical protein
MKKYLIAFFVLIFLLWTIPWYFYLKSRLKGDLIAPKTSLEILPSSNSWETLDTVSVPTASWANSDSNAEWEDEEEWRDAKFEFGIEAIKNVKTEKISLVVTASDGNNHSCSNLELDSSVKRENDTVTLTVKGIKDSELCATSFWPATLVQDLDVEVSSGKVYLFDILYSWKKDSYRIHIYSQSIKIEPIKATFSKTKKNLLYFVNQDLLYVSCFYNESWDKNPFDERCKDFFRTISEKFPEYVKSIQDDPDTIQESGIYIVKDSMWIDTYMDALFEQFYTPGYYMIAYYQNKEYFHHFCECTKWDFRTLSMMGTREECLKEEWWTCEYKNLLQNSDTWSITSMNSEWAFTGWLEYRKYPKSIEACQEERLPKVCVTEFAIRKKDATICEKLNEYSNEQYSIKVEDCRKYVQWK